MLLPLPTPAEMAIWDHKTIKTIGIPGVTLMESAAREAVAVLLKTNGANDRHTPSIGQGPLDGQEIFCFAGSGNNGGDAFAMARHLTDLGADVTVFHTLPKKRYRGEARIHLELARRVGVSMRHLDAADAAGLPQPDIVVDGLLGTGLTGPLRPDSLALVRAVNRLGRRAFVLSIDIPSGLSGLTGQPQPEAVHADATVTFQAAKLGLAMPGAAQFTGSIHVRPIGIPNRIIRENPARHELLTDAILSRIPRPDPAMHKGSAGSVLIIGGSPGLTGAPRLAALGALRAGAGLVTVACPGGLADSVKGGSADIMTLPLGSGREWTPELANILQAELGRFHAVVVGPGLGRTMKTVDFLKSFVAQCPTHTVLDADALFCLAQIPETVHRLSETTILTPHPGEMARLIGQSTDEIQAARLDTARTFVETCRSVLVLKGAGTLIADRDRVRISPHAEPNLAVGGSGDVLAGVIAALMARGMRPAEAAALGVHWHGTTGRLLRENYPARGNLASEIADMLPQAAKEFSPC
ncbi:NAD(P)H-hydrate dehydratase [Pseudodesulfovibrio sp. F-1]|uniref:Bifunctional NAD(P)H-hydrate repair enzyme n=1 Tax=Pseudodesulfovibrio alkaliphilus TaxID=2661613 RepID=A0A7K1KQN9_9BACT|nr:NAD(P)H-hydrate dehydratase [Pseudodesulfovibrio alkaliphilus]MUM78404.1 NAD(P)H-hydrate dehydratase [Pseudodesulfovibrio alkaliphilus]